MIRGKSMKKTKKYKKERMKSETVGGKLNEMLKSKDINKRQEKGSMERVNIDRIRERRE